MNDRDNFLAERGKIGGDVRRARIALAGLSDEQIRVAAEVRHLLCVALFLLLLFFFFFFFFSFSLLSGCCWVC